MDTFYTREELAEFSFAKLGEDVWISRNALIYHPEKVEIGSHVRIDDFAILSGRICLHSYIHIAQFCGLYGGESGIIMEDYSSLSSKVSVYAVSDDFSGHSMVNPMIPLEYRPGHTDKPVKLEKFVAVGASSVVLPGVTLREGSCFTAMSLILRDSEADMIYAGVPARRVKDRSRDYRKLEEEFRQSKTNV